jgi:hypothetical protein
MKFEELIKTLDGDIWVEIYSMLGDVIYTGKLKDLKYIPDKVMRIIPQSTSRQVYLEIYVY